MENAEFQDFLQALREGDEPAAEQLLRRYEAALRRVIHLRLTDQHLRRVFDSGDIFNSILLEFLKRVRKGEFALHSLDDLGNLLVTMALNKLRSKARKERRHTGGLPEQWDPAADELSPSQAASRQDLVQEVRRRLGAFECRLHDLKAAGKTWAEVAAEVGGDPSSLRIRLARAITRVRKELQQEDSSHE